MILTSNPNEPVISQGSNDLVAPQGTNKKPPRPPPIILTPPVNIISLQEGIKCSA